MRHRLVVTDERLGQPVFREHAPVVTPAHVGFVGFRIVRAAFGETSPLIAR
jgi:hypothetical protein